MGLVKDDYVAKRRNIDYIKISECED